MYSINFSRQDIQNKQYYKIYDDILKKMSNAYVLYCQICKKQYPLHQGTTMYVYSPINELQEYNPYYILHNKTLACTKFYDCKNDNCETKTNE